MYMHKDSKMTYFFLMAILLCIDKKNAKNSIFRCNYMTHILEISLLS